ncbi:MAG: iron ABC transporter permease [Hyphomicrobium sp.]|nr:iron ABC transporter permease [Hyphomicrobium sp.]
MRPVLSSANSWALTAIVAAMLLALPLLAVAWIALSATDTIWPHLMATVLPRALSNTALLLVGAGTLALMIGTPAAWLVTMYRFPGRSLADRMLVLPLAMPVYIVAYAYVDLLDFAGPVQTALRAAFGNTSLAAHIIPDVRSLHGAIALFAFVLYPYVYLSARATFIQQSVCALEVARTLGQTAGGTFWSVALPMARPALIAGVALVMMECLNDLGAVQYLGVETLSASIYATWTQRSNLPGAAQLALVMMALVAALLIGERAARGEAAFHATTGRYRSIPFEVLEGWRAALALACVTIPVVLGFAVPFAVIVLHAGAHLNGLDWAAFAAAARNSLVLAGLVSAAAVTLAMIFAYAARLHRSPATLFAVRASALGYALPGTVLAIGLLAPLAAFDNAVDAWMRAQLGVSTGLVLSGSLFAVTLALVIRFLAVALGSIESGLERISPNIDAAAKTLGTGSASALRRIHLPMLKPAIGAAALLVFVDAMKELPATLLLRPFNFETLATHIYGLTAAEQFEEAATGAVAIVVIGLIPVLMLHNAIAGGRTGSQG